MATTTNIWLNFGISTPQNPKFERAKPLKASSFDFPLASKIMVRNLLKARTEILQWEEYSVQDLGRCPLSELKENDIEEENLSYSTTESCLEKEFSNFGAIAEVKIIKDEVRKRSKGYAFIQYSSQEAALQALENMDQKYVDGRLIYVELAKLDKRSYYRPPITSGPPTRQMTSTLQEEESE